MLGQLEGNRSQQLHARLPYLHRTSLRHQEFASLLLPLPSRSQRGLQELQPLSSRLSEHSYPTSRDCSMASTEPARPFYVAQLYPYQR
jgi:hypothetical protein